MKKLVDGSNRKFSQIATIFGVLIGPRNINTDFSVQINWTDRRGNLIGQPVAIPICSSLWEISQGADFVPEAGQSMATARQEAIHRLAEQIVSQMEVPW